MASEEGLRTADSKVEVIVRAPAPKNVTELRSFLGLVNYYGKFLPNLATILTPLYSLLQKGSHWSWGDRQAQAFHEVKRLLQSSRVLVHFDGSLPLILSCNASPYGSTLPHYAQWRRPTCCICLPHTHYNREEIFAARKRSISDCIWCSPILVWQKI